MIIERSQIEGMKMGELKNMAVAIGAHPSPVSETKEMLVNRILMESAKEPRVVETTPEQDITRGEPSNIPPLDMADVLKAVNKYVLLGMKVYHNPDNHTWRFMVERPGIRVKDTNTGNITTISNSKEDSGTLRQPLSVIVRCAAAIMRGVNKQEIQQQAIDPTAQGYIAVA